jgi:hypothetical protein
MNKYTPGPWKVEGTPRRGWDIFSSAKGCYVAFDEPLREGAISLEGDARLIAAAPELLEALENLLKVHEGEGGTQCHAGDIARAAIAKAKGQT